MKYTEPKIIAKYGKKGVLVSDYTKPRCVYDFTNEEDLIRTQGKSAISNFGIHTSAQRQQLLASQIEAMVLPILAESPMSESQHIQEIFGSSSCISPINRGVITLLKKISFQDVDYYIYKNSIDGVVDYHKDEKYIYSNNFCSRAFTDFSTMEEGDQLDVTYDKETHSRFFKEFPSQFDPISQTVGYGINAVGVNSTVVENALDGVPISESLAERLGALRYKTINIYLQDKEIVSRYQDIFPEMHEYLDDYVLFKIVSKSDDVENLAQSKTTPSGYEEESIIVEPYTYINRIEVYANDVIGIPKLDELRTQMLDYRREIYDFVSEIRKTEMISEELDILSNNCMYNKFRDGDRELSHPLIIVHTKTVSVAEISSKLTTLSGAKVTVRDVYKDGTYKTEDGRNIEIIMPATAYVSRSITGGLYEVLMNSIGEFITDAVRLKTVTPEQLKAAVIKMHYAINMHREVDNLYSRVTAEEHYELIRVRGFKWIFNSYSTSIDIPHISDVTEVAEQVFGFKERVIIAKGQIGEPHVVGTIFILRLMQDKYHHSSGSSTPETNKKGHIVEKSSEKKDGRALFSKKAAKLSILTINKLLNRLNHADVSIILDDEIPLYGTHQSMVSVGFELVTTRKYLGNKLLDLEEEGEE